MDSSGCGPGAGSFAFRRLAHSDVRGCGHKGLFVVEADAGAAARIRTMHRTRPRCGQRTGAHSDRDGSSSRWTPAWRWRPARWRGFASRVGSGQEDGCNAGERGHCTHAHYRNARENFAGHNGALCYCCIALDCAGVMGAMGVMGKRRLGGAYPCAVLPPHGQAPQTPLAHGTRRINCDATLVASSLPSFVPEPPHVLPQAHVHARVHRA